MLRSVLIGLTIFLVLGCSVPSPTDSGTDGSSETETEQSTETQSVDTGDLTACDVERPGSP